MKRLVDLNRCALFEDTSGLVGSAPFKLGEGRRQGGPDIEMNRWDIYLLSIQNSSLLFLDISTSIDISTSVDISTSMIVLLSTPGAPSTTTPRGWLPPAPCTWGSQPSDRRGDVKN